MLKGKLGTTLSDFTGFKRGFSCVFYVYIFLGVTYICIFFIYILFKKYIFIKTNNNP